MSEATASDIVRVANDLADENGRVKITAVKTMFGRMTSVQFDDLLSRAVNAGRLYLITDETLGVKR